MGNTLEKRKSVCKKLEGMTVFVAGDYIRNSRLFSKLETVDIFTDNTELQVYETYDESRITVYIDNISENVKFAVVG